MRILLILSTAIILSSFGTIYQVYKNDKRIYGKWKVTLVDFTDKSNGSHQLWLDQNKMSREEFNDMLKKGYGKLELKFEENNNLIIYNSPEQSEPVKGLYRMQKTSNVNEAKLEIAGSEALAGKPYVITFIGTNKAKMVYPEWNGKVFLNFHLSKQPIK